jgi:type I restriction enzyme M protein
MTEQELARVIWNIKEIIRNFYDDSEVEDVILPFTLLRRLDCVLDEHRDEIITELESIVDADPERQKNKREMKLKSLLRRYNLTFFNASGLSLKKLLANPASISSNFKTYLEGFTDNVKDILSNFVHQDGEAPDLTQIYRRLEKSNKLYSVVQTFVQQADLDPKKVSNAQMGTVFEIVIRWSKESTNSKAGQYYTPREIVRLLASLTLYGQEQKLQQLGQMFSIYDPCCGTGGMLTVAKEMVQEMSGRDNIKIYLYGQELNEKTYAICKSDLLIKGDLQHEDKQIRQGDTLADDKFENQHFNFMLANPPFGVDWGKDENVKKKVEEDNAPNRRFEAGLPSKNDGSLLFLMHMISKMDNTQGSRIGIVLNGSPLFNGDAGGGWSNIRQSLLDKNLLDAIVALPKNLFYGTDISSYLWILDNKRPADRYHKVLFIDATCEYFTTPLQRSLGKKRYEISKIGAEAIMLAYKTYDNFSIPIDYLDDGTFPRKEIAKLLDYDDFLYTKVTVLRPKRLSFCSIAEKYELLLADEDFNADAPKNQILKTVSALGDIDAKRTDADFFRFLKEQKVKVSAAEVKLLRASFGERDEAAPEILINPYKATSGFEADPDLNDTEIIPFKKDIDEYFSEEVLPFVPDAWMDRTKDKVGCEFPFLKLFYEYKPLRDSSAILEELKLLDEDMGGDIKNLN